MLIEYHFFKSFSRYNIEGFEFVWHLKTHQFCMFDNNKGIIIPTLQRNKILSTETIEEIISWNIFYPTTNIVITSAYLFSFDWYWVWNYKYVKQHRTSWHNDNDFLYNHWVILICHGIGRKWKFNRSRSTKTSMRTNWWWFQIDL